MFILKFMGFWGKGGVTVNIYIEKRKLKCKSNTRKTKTELIMWPV